MTGNNISIQRGFSDAQREQVAALYWTAFAQKLEPIFRQREPALRVIAASLKPDYSFVALAGEQVAGVAGFKDAQGSLLDLTPAAMTRAFGFVGGWLRLLGLSIFARAAQPGVLLMDGIVVNAELRGGGIGSHLLDAIVAYGREQGYSSVRLDVVDTNPRARQLYERKGFVVVAEQRYLYLRPIFGFSGAATMLNTCKE
jgi:ribosomal protein S18 acetylase RimI-like enzyme